MKSNIFFIATCDLGPLQFLLWGLIPFLLGWLLGWLLWGRFKRRVEELESQVRDLTKSNSDIDAKLATCKTKNDDLSTRNNNLESELTNYKTRYTNLESRLAEKSRSATEAAASFVAPVSSPSKPKSDNLKKIEGIGPKTNELLNKAGIHTFSDLSDASTDHLRTIFSQAGPNYQLIDPDSWPTQAQLARDGKWDDLKEYQDYLIGGVDPAKIANTNTDDNLDLDAAKSVFGKKINLNDLKLIEGIGPKIETILNGADITTWRELASTRVDRLNTILEEHDLQFHNPKTWPRQAAMAAAGLWKDLLSWQDALDGGKE